jgi:peptidoglycan/xylan/chitin deacetylase (PgdA/CDA1 family)
VHGVKRDNFARNTHFFAARGAFLLIFGSLALLATACSSDLRAGDTTTVPTTLATTTSTPATTSTTTSTTSTTTTTLPRGFPTSSIAPILPVNGLSAKITHVETTDRVVFLTIDDGIVKDPAAMQFLLDNKMPATLFLVSGEFRKDPAYFAQILSVGGTISSHTMHHPALKGLSLQRQTSEICNMKNAIAEELGFAGHLMRPPYGSSDENTRRASASCGINAVVNWNSELWEGHVDILQRPGLQPGDIFLTHFRTDLLDNLIAFKAALDQQGFTIGRLEDYLPNS